MTKEQVVVTDLQIELNNYRRGMTDATRLAAQLDRQLMALVRSANTAEAALNKLAQQKIDVKVDRSALTAVESDVRRLGGTSAKIDVQVNADTASIQTELNALTPPDLRVNVTTDAAAIQTELNALTTPDLQVNVTTDTSQVRSEINSIDAPTLNIPVGVDAAGAQALINDLQGKAKRVMVEVDADTDKAETRIGNVSRRKPKIEAEVTADTSKADKEIRDLLSDITGQAKIEIALEVAPVGGGAVGGFAGRLIDPILEADRALKTLQGTTEGFIPDADKLISDVFTSGWAESREEIAAAIGQFVRLRGASDDMAGDISSTFATAQVMGKEFNEVLNATDRLVSSGLVGSVQEANDLLVTGFQRGGDRADDLVDTFVEYSTQFAQIGIDGATAMDLINQSLALGTFNSDKLGDTFKELNLRITEAVNDEAGAAFDALERIGFLDEAKALEAGEITGAQFAAGMQKALNEGKATEFDLYEIFGTPLEDFGIDIFSQLDFGAAENTIIPEGAAEAAAGTINDNLNQTLLETGRLIEEEILGKLGGVEGILDTINDKAQEFNNLLRGGADIPEALEIILEMPGLADNIKKLEMVLGNFLIELLTAFANVGEGLGFDVSGIRVAVTEAATQQFKFDIQADDSIENFEFAVQQALRRGVSTADLGDLVGRAGQEMVDQGDIARATDLLSVIQQLPDAFVEVRGRAANDLLAPTETFRLPITPELATDPAAVQAMVAEFAASNALVTYGQEVKLTPAVDTGALEGVIDTVRTDFTDALNNAKNLVGDVLNMPFGNNEAVDALSAVDATNIAAAALATKDIAGALEATTAAGWPITEVELTALADAETDFYALQTALTEYRFGLEDAKTDGVAALTALKQEGIEPTVTAQELLTKDTSLYFLGLTDQLEIAKVSWQSYADFVNTLEVNPPATGAIGGTTPPIGGSFAVGTTSVPRDMLAMVHAGEAILPPAETSALRSLLSFFSMGGGAPSVSTSTTYNINLNSTMYNQNAAAGRASSDRLSDQLRGFVS